MQSQLLNLLLGPNNPMSSNLMSLAKSAELAETAAQGFEAFQTGKLPEFVERQYDTNIIFRKFYDKHKDQTLKDFFAEIGAAL